MIRPVVIAIPIFALLIAAEYWWSNRQGSDEFADRRDMWNNIFIGFVSVAFGSFFGIFIAVIYSYCYELSLYKFPPEAWWSWVILFFVDDLAYYVFHRVSHESRLFWNFHVVHHSSERFNLSVAVRQSWFGGMVFWIFYTPVMLLGFAPWMFAITHGFNLIYQFWVHTRFIDRLGWVEYIFNTPSHHRVHHGINSKYLDRNYAGVLIIWDRLFGSFVAETETPRYGIIKPIKSYHPLWINTHGWFEMKAAIMRQPTLARKIRCIFASPNMDLDNNYEN